MNKTTKEMKVAGPMIHGQCCLYNGIWKSNTPNDWQISIPAEYVKSCGHFYKFINYFEEIEITNITYYTLAALIPTEAKTSFQH